MKKYSSVNLLNKGEKESEKKRKNGEKELKRKAEWENPTIYQADVQMYCMSEG